MEDTVKELEKRWAEIQDKALKQPSPGIFNRVNIVLLIPFSKLDIKDFCSSERENVGQTTP